MKKTLLVTAAAALLSSCSMACRTPDTEKAGHQQTAQQQAETTSLNPGWVHAREAVLGSQLDVEQLESFYSYCNEMIKNQGLDQVGTSMETILAQLGAPDMRSTTKDGVNAVLVYGVCIMEFVSGKLVKCEYPQG